LNTILTVQAKPIERLPDLYSYETSYDKLSYITRRHVRDAMNNELGDVFIISIPKKYGSETMLPQLFKQYDRNDPENSQVYSYALYSKNDLIASSSKYPFVTSLIDDQQPKIEFEKRKNGDYDEMWYKDINEKVVVIARKEDSTIESITLFSWIFCFFSFYDFCCTTYISCIKSRVQLGRVPPPDAGEYPHAGAHYVYYDKPVVVYNYRRSYHFIFYSRFNRSNIDKLSRTMKVMVNEMQRNCRGRDH